MLAFPSSSSFLVLVSTVWFAPCSSQAQEAACPPCPLEITITGFIPGRLGQVIDGFPGTTWHQAVPGVRLIWGSTDGRELGEAGGSRVTTHLSLTDAATQLLGSSSSSSNSIPQFSDVTVGTTQLLLRPGRLGLLSPRVIATSPGTLVTSSYVNYVTRVDETTTRWQLQGGAQNGTPLVPDFINPDVNWDFRVTAALLDHHNQDGELARVVQITVDGQHDVFPDWEIIVNGDLVYGFQTEYAGIEFAQALWQPPMDLATPVATQITCGPC